MQHIIVSRAKCGKMSLTHTSAWSMLVFLPVLSALAGAQPASSSKDEDTVKLQAVYGHYQREALAGKGADTATSREFWERQFSDALAGTKGGGMIRLRMLDELGAIQKNLGKRQAAVNTYRQLEEYAKRIDDIEAMTTAAENELELVNRESPDVVSRAAAKLESSVERLANKQAGPATLNRLSNDLMAVGMALNGRSDEIKDEKQRKHFLERASGAFERAVALGQAGATPLPGRMYWVAQTLSKLGRKQEAGAIYGKLAEMDQKIMSRLWMAFLQIKEGTTKDSDAYREAIEGALASFEKRGGVDDFEITMRHELGLSYRKAGQFETSTRILSSLVGKSKDNALNAYNLFLVAFNTLDSGKKDAGREMLADVVRQYPGTGSAQAAASELKRLSDDEAEKRAAAMERGAGGFTTRGRVAIMLLNVGMAAALGAFLSFRWYKRSSMGGVATEKRVDTMKRE